MFTSELSRVVTISVVAHANYKPPATLRKPVLRYHIGNWHLGYRRPNGDFLVLLSFYTKEDAVKAAGSREIRSYFENQVGKRQWP